MSKLEEHWYTWRGFYVVGFFLLSVTAILLHIDYKYPCIRGHYERQWRDNYIYINGNMQYMGGNYEDVFVCDCRTTRDSLEYYNNKNK